MFIFNLESPKVQKYHSKLTGCQTKLSQKLLQAISANTANQAAPVPSVQMEQRKTRN